MTVEREQLDVLATLTRAQAGDLEATEQLIQQYSRLVRSISRRYFLYGAEGEDVIQEGMLGLLYAIRSYDFNKESSFSSYVYLCVERRLISALRSSSAQKNEPLNHAISLDRSLDESEMEGMHGISGANPESRMIHREEQRESLERLSRHLSHLEARVLSLYLDGLSYAEIASALNRPMKSIDNAIQRVRQKAESISYRR